MDAEKGEAGTTPDAGHPGEPPEPAGPAYQPSAPDRESGTDRPGLSGVNGRASEPPAVDVPPDAAPADGPAAAGTANRIQPGTPIPGFPPAGPPPTYHGNPAPFHVTATAGGPVGWPVPPHPDPHPPTRGTSGLPRPPEPAPRTHRWGLGAYLLVELVFLVTSTLVGLLLGGEGQLGAEALAVALAVPTVIAAGLAMLITRLRGGGPGTDLRLSWSWRDVRLGLAFGIGGLVVTLPASVLYVTVVGEGATSAVGEVFGDVRASLPLALVIFLTVVLIAPLCEEIVYRGLLWGAVERLGARPWIAMVVTTLLFALAHFEFARTPLLLVVAVPIALARLYTGGLLASIVAHQVNNLLPGIALLLGLLGVIPMS